MTRIVAALLTIAAVCPRPVDAHQLDEYLQATRIGLESDRIVISMSLTPGVSVADQILTAVDRNHDGQVSGPEIEAYGRRVLQDLTLELDGQSCPVQLVRAEFPATSEMREGLGTIRLEAAVTAPLDVAGHHQLRFMNFHRTDISVYLVNALMPSTGTISIRNQQRDVLQRSIRLEFDRASAVTNAVWVLFPLVSAAALIASRRPVRPRRAPRHLS